MKKEFLFDKNDMAIGMGKIKDHCIYASCNSIQNEINQGSANLYKTLDLNSDIFSEEERTLLISIFDKCYNELLNIETL